MERYFPRRHFASATFVSATLQVLLFSRHFDNVPYFIMTVDFLEHKRPN